MNTRLHLLWVLCVLCGSSFGLDRNAFTFAAYDLEVRIDPSTSGLDARGKITLRNDSATPQRALALQISSSLAWRSVRLADKPLALTTSQYTSDIDHTGALTEAIVTLPADVAPKHTVQLEVSYGGTVSQNATRLTRVGAPDDIAKTTEWDQISPTITAVRGVGYVTWYPVSIEAASLSDGNRVATLVDLWKLRHVSSRMAVAYTVLGDGTVAGNNACVSSEQTRTCLLEPLGFAVPFFVIGNYESIERPNLRLAYIANHKDALTRSEAALAAVLPFTTEWFGSPHSAVSVVDSSLPPYVSSETATTALQSLDSDNLSHVLASLLTRAAVGSSRLWISEGLPVFASWLRVASAGQRPPAAVAGISKAIAAAESQAGGDEPLIRSTDPILYRMKAAFVWWMLRDLVGDSALKSTIHAYRAEDDREPSYVQRLLRRFSNRDLEWFFDDWVYRDRGLPDFKIDSAFPRPLLNREGQASGYTVTVTVENLGNAGAEVPVMVRTAQGDVSERVEVRAKSKAVTRIQVPASPTEIVVNDGSVPESDATNNTFRLSAK